MSELARVVLVVIKWDRKCSNEFTGTYSKIHFCNKDIMYVTMNDSNDFASALSKIFQKVKKLFSR